MHLKLLVIMDDWSSLESLIIKLTIFSRNSHKSLTILSEIDNVTEFILSVCWRFEVILVVVPWLSSCGDVVMHCHLFLILLIVKFRRSCPTLSMELLSHDGRIATTNSTKIHSNQKYDQDYLLKSRLYTIWDTKYYTLTKWSSKYLSNNYYSVQTNLYNSSSSRTSR